MNPYSESCLKNVEHGAGGVRIVQAPSGGPTPGGPYETEAKTSPGRVERDLRGV
jgi:hypothetical protein